MISFERTLNGNRKYHISFNVYYHNKNKMGVNFTNLNVIITIKKVYLESTFLIAYITIKNV